MIARVERQLSCKVKSIRSDDGIQLGSMVHAISRH